MSTTQPNTRLDDYPRADRERSLQGHPGVTAGRRRKRILIAVDDSTPSEWAARAGGELAVALGADLTLLHVVTLATAVVDDYVTAQRLDAANREAGRELLARMQLHLPAGTEPTLVAREGAPGDEIVRAARDERSDLIVVGTRGRGRLAQFLLGSTAEWVIRHAPCPVLTVGHAPAAAVPSVVPQGAALGAD